MDMTKSSKSSIGRCGVSCCSEVRREDGVVSGNRAGLGLAKDRGMGGKWVQDRRSEYMYC